MEPGAAIRVLSLPTLLRSIAAIPSNPKHGLIGRLESSEALGDAVEHFVRSMALATLAPAAGRPRRSQHVVDSMRRAPEAVSSDPELSSWLRSLPPWPQLQSDAKYLPMLATVALALNPLPTSERFGHLIVDEAQDVSPSEWRILKHFLLEPRGQFSLFGDINQRRSDWSASSWQDVARQLKLTDDGNESVVQELVTGYRSTKQILQFAGHLLPKKDRVHRALRDGPEPRVQKVQRGATTREAVAQAIDLASRHVGGSVAVIAVEPSPVWS